MGEGLEPMPNRDETLPISEESFSDEKFDQIRHSVGALRYNYKLSDEEMEEIAKSVAQNKSILHESFKQKDSVIPFTVIEDVTYLSEHHNERIAKIGMGLLEELVPDIEREALGKTATVREQDAIRVYYKLSESEDVVQKELGATMLAKHLSAIKNGLRKKETYFYNLLCIEQVIKLGADTREDAREAMTILFEATKAAKNEEHFPSLVSAFYKFPDFEYIGGEFVEEFLTEVGLPWPDFFEAWKLSDNQESLSSVVFRNMNRIREIEKSEKGIARFLFEEFGIVDFGRYPTELLLKQKQEFESLENPYGVVIFPRNDWNGAFYGDVEILQSFYEELAGQFSLRIFECESKIDLAKTLIKCDRRYNPEAGGGHKISLIILGGHGQKDKITFGGQDSLHRLTAEDLFGKGVQRAGTFFEDNPTMILNSCSTGKEGGIGEILSKKFGVKVIAPSVPTGLKALHAGRNRGQTKFRFNALYTEGEQHKSVFKGRKESY